MPQDPSLRSTTGLELRAVRDGTRLRLRVKAGARRTALLGVHDGALRLSVVSAPERGKANRSVLQLVASSIGLPQSALELLTGTSSPNKVVFVPLPPAEVASRLDALLG
jgi:uncharacterized protein YggU (UPF0235/DUF167 family)